MIVSFPTAAERSWPETEVTIRQILLQANAPPSAIDWIIADIKPRVLALDATQRLSVPCAPESLDGVTAVFDQMKRLLHETTSRAFVELVKIEIELWAAKFSDCPR